jgi:hypothetical protein
VTSQQIDGRETITVRCADCQARVERLIEVRQTPALAAALGRPVLVVA